MKNTRFFVLAFGALIFLAACGKVEKILPKGEGTWKVTTYLTSDYVNNVLDTTYTTTNPNPAITFVFEKDGVGTYTVGSTSIAMTWDVDADGEKVTICRDISGNGTLICSVNTILESSSKSQTWFSTSQTTGFPDWQEVTVTMERQ